MQHFDSSILSYLTCLQENVENITLLVSKIQNLWFVVYMFHQIQNVQICLCQIYKMYDLYVNLRICYFFPLNTYFIKELNDFKKPLGSSNCG